MGTTSMTSKWSSLSRSALTSFASGWVPGTGEWCAVGTATGSNINFMGGPSIIGSRWCLHMLKVLGL